MTEQQTGSAAGDRYYQVVDSWDSRGYRLYYGDDQTMFQVHGEINGRVFRTIHEAQAYCKRLFGEDAVRMRGWMGSGSRGQSVRDRGTWDDLRKEDHTRAL